MFIIMSSPTLLAIVSKRCLDEVGFTLSIFWPQLDKVCVRNDVSLCSSSHRRQKDVRLTQCVTVTDSETILHFFVLSKAATCCGASAAQSWTQTGLPVSCGDSPKFLWAQLVREPGSSISLWFIALLSFALQQDSLLTLCCCFLNLG